MTESQINPLMERIRMPGQTFTLPSGGLFYKNGELDDEVINAEIHVFPMTAIDEIVMKTPDMLFSGEAVKQVFSRCIPQIKKPGEMLVKDVDFLLTCLRKVSYGDMVSIDYKHSCKGAKQHSYQIDVTQFITSVKKINPTQIGSKFKVTLPNDQIVHIQPIRFDAFVKLLQRMENKDKKTPEQQRDEMADSYADLILQVDEVTNKEHILEWLRGLRPELIKKLENSVDATAHWGLSFDTKVKCLDCKKVATFTAPLNPMSFFT